MACTAVPQRGAGQTALSVYSLEALCWVEVPDAKGYATCGIKRGYAKKGLGPGVLLPTMQVSSCTHLLA